MALPPSFENAQHYFETAIGTFEKFQHIFNFPNTKVLSKNLLENINIKNIDNVVLYHRDFKLNDVASSNEFIQDFIADIDNLTVVYKNFECVEEEKDLNAPIGDKKRHEILYLAQEIKELCEVTTCDTVIDFGSGLGYLDQHLQEVSNLNILGLECCKQNCANALKRQEKYFTDSTERVKYVNHMITKESVDFIEGSLSSSFEKSKSVCITGLHACADLTIDTFELFFKMSKARCLMLMSCCYHRMMLNTNQDKRFVNFPISKCLKGIFTERNCSEYLNIPFLRLASQPPFWVNDLQELVFNLLARATLELYAERNQYSLTRSKRKAVNTKTTENNFETYIQKIQGRFSLSCKTCRIYSNNNKCTCNLEFNLEELRNIWRQNTEMTFKKAAIFILLQRHLQPAFENFIMFDRIMYLKENNVSNSYVKRIFDFKISPRCLAIVAIKDI